MLGGSERLPAVLLNDRGGRRHVTVPNPPPETWNLCIPVITRMGSGHLQLIFDREPFCDEQVVVYTLRGMHARRQ